jgi:AcrR family transcriptional regulator
MRADGDAAGPAGQGGAAARSRGGRKRDHSRDTVILEATLDILAETDYERMTIDAVAARAGAARATVYRRWPTKVDLVLDALKQLGPSAIDLQRLPDTGSLRGDCIAAMQPDTGEESERPVLTDGGIEPWVQANRILIQRAVDRGEYGPVDVDALAQVLPLMCTCRVAVQQLPITAEYSIALIDGVLLAAMRGNQP